MIQPVGLLVGDPHLDVDRRAGPSSRSCQQNSRSDTRQEIVTRRPADSALTAAPSGSRGIRPATSCSRRRGPADGRRRRPTTAGTGSGRAAASTPPRLAQMIGLTDANVGMIICSSRVGSQQLGSSRRSAGVRARARRGRPPAADRGRRSCRSSPPGSIGPARGDSTPARRPPRRGGARRARSSPRAAATRACTRAMRGTSAHGWSARPTGSRTAARSSAAAASASPARASASAHGQRRGGPAHVRACVQSLAKEGGRVGVARRRRARRGRRRGSAVAAISGESRRSAHSAQSGRRRGGLRVAIEPGEEERLRGQAGDQEHGYRLGRRNRLVGEDERALVIAGTRQRAGGVDVDPVRVVNPPRRWGDPRPVRTTSAHSANRRGRIRPKMWISAMSASVSASSGSARNSRAAASIGSTAPGSPATASAQASPTRMSARTVA